MFIAYKYKLCPTQEQKTQLDNNMAAARFVYNRMLSASTANYEETGKSYLPLISEIKKDNTWLNDADSKALCSARLNLQIAFRNFFGSLNGSRKKTIGKPKFKSRFNYRQSYTTHGVRLKEQNGMIFIKLPKISPIELVYHRPVCGAIRSVTVSRSKTNKYEVSVLCKKELIDINKKPLNELSIIGVDMSFNNFAVLSTGEKLNYPKYYRSSEGKSKKLQRKYCKKRKGSANREKGRVRHAKQQARVTNQRKDFCHKLSKELIMKYDIIVLEDISLKGLAQSMNFGKSVYDLGFGLFRRYLEYKARIYDKQVFIVDKFFPSSQMCSNCREVYKLVADLKIRNWDCPNCGINHDRDINAAVNLKNYFVEKLNESIAQIERKKNTDGTLGIYACGEKSNTLILPLRERLKQVFTLKQENKSRNK